MSRSADAIIADHKAGLSVPRFNCDIPKLVEEIERMRVEIEQLRTHIASAPPPAVVHVNPDTYKTWYQRELTKGSAEPADRAYPEKTFDQIVEVSLNQPSLADALTHACIWEAERAIRQAERNQFSDWETCFNYVIHRVVRAWTEKGSD